MMTGLYVLRDFPYNHFIPPPRASKLIYHIDVIPAVKKGAKRYELKEQVLYRVIDVIARRIIGQGHYQMNYEIRFDAKGITAQDLFSGVEAVCNNIWGYLAHHFENRPNGIFCIDGPTFEDLYFLLKDCADELNELASIQSI